MYLCVMFLLSGRLLIIGYLFDANVTRLYLGIVKKVNTLTDFQIFADDNALKNVHNLTLHLVIRSI